MDRRNFFSSSLQVVGETLTETTTSKSSSTTGAKVVPQRPTSGLARYNGVWDYQRAGHLLRRTLFGPTDAEIKQAVEDGLQKTLERLIDPRTTVDLPPLNYEVPQDLHWVNSLEPKASLEFRKQSLKGWWIDKMLNQDVHLQEKMTLFWHNHLVTSLNGVDDPRMSYEYLQLLRNKGLGNFKTLMLEFSKCAATLVYLHGNQNKKGSPNEDFARELMELFTLGRETPTGAKNYDEQDVIEVARALTGWVTIAGGNGLSVLPFTGFSSAAHDTGQKKFSAHFNNAIIQRALPIEYSLEMNDVMEMIFAKQATSENIIREIYRWFVYYDIDATTEQNVIVPLAQMFVDNNYEIAPVMAILLSSEHFYDSLIMGCLIKSPVDFVVGTVRQTYQTVDRTRINATPQGRHTFALSLHRYMVELQMDLLDPPNVAGWKAYYQTPAFHQTWLNTVTLLKRFEFVDTYLFKKISYKPVHVSAPVENGVEVFTEFNANLFLIELCQSDVTDVNKVIDKLVAVLFPQGVTMQQRQTLQTELMGSLADSEWTNEWVESIALGNNVAKQRIVKFLHLLFNMAEFQLA